MPFTGRKLTLFRLCLLVNHGTGREPGLDRFKNLNFARRDIYALKFPHTMQNM